MRSSVAQRLRLLHCEHCFTVKIWRQLIYTNCVPISRFQVLASFVVLGHLNHPSGGGEAFGSMDKPLVGSVEFKTPYMVLDPQLSTLTEHAPLLSCLFPAVICTLPETPLALSHPPVAVTDYDYIRPGTTARSSPTPALGFLRASPARVSTLTKVD